MFAGFQTHPAASGPEPLADARSVSARLAPFHRPDREGIWQSDSAWLLVQRDFNATESRNEPLPCQCPQTGAVLAFWGRLDNRADLADALGIPANGLAAIADSQLILAAWCRWGERLPERLVGDFALAVLDPARRSAFLARDALGVKPLYYALNRGRLSFASNVSALLALDSVAPEPDGAWMARYLAGLSMSDRTTAYRGVAKLPPGHCLAVGADGREQLRRWHHWRDDAPPARRREARWVDAYRERLEEAVRCRMRSDYALGTENSGGLDSATITAYLARFLEMPNERLHGFSFATAEQEPAFILEVSQAARITHNYILTAPALSIVDESVSRGLRAVGYPLEHVNGASHLPFYRECETRGIRTLFSGFGGDEAATHPGHLLRWELLDGHRYRELWDILPGNGLARALRLGKAALAGRTKPAFNPGFLHAWRDRWPHRLLRPHVVERLDIERAYWDGARYDAPYRRINDFILRHLLAAPYVATRLENCTLMAATYGVEYRWPLWDARLVQQYLSTPSIEKMGPGGVGRYLHRRAVDGVVPHRVAWKPSKDMGETRTRDWADSVGMRILADQARRHEVNLHPALDELIDRPKLRQQAAMAAAGKPDAAFAFVFRRSVRALRWLNEWLHGSALH